MMWNNDKYAMVYLQWTMRALDNKQDEDVELPQHKSHKKRSIPQETKAICNM
jgi:hypothetical protein